MQRPTRIRSLIQSIAGKVSRKQARLGQTWAHCPGKLGIEPLEDRRVLAVFSLNDFGTLIDSSVVQDRSIDLSGQLPVGTESDSYVVNLRAGDVLSASLFGATSGGSMELQLHGRVSDIGNEDYFHKSGNPIKSPGTEDFAYVIDQDGEYSINVNRYQVSGTIDYRLQLRLYRNPMESKPVGAIQTLYLDFDGGIVNTQQLFGIGGMQQANIPTFSSYLAGWGLQPGDETALINKIVQVVNENFSDVAGGNNPLYGLQILDSRTTPDIFGQPYVSRVMVSASAASTGITGFRGLAESYDPGNFRLQETALVFLDTLISGPSNLNNVARATGVPMVDLVGTVIGNIVSHEAGHLFGCSLHTDASANPSNVMDEGGPIGRRAGVGPDNIFGTADDIDVDFGIDVMSFLENYNSGYGYVDTLNWVAFGLSTGAAVPLSGFFVASQFGVNVLHYLGGDFTNDQVSLRGNGTPGVVIADNGTGPQTFTGISRVVVETLGGFDRLTVDLISGGGIPAYNIFFDGGDSNDSLHLTSNSTNSTLSDFEFSAAGGTFQFSSVDASLEWTGNSSSNSIDASAVTKANVTLRGEGGNDTLIGSPLRLNYLYGGPGNDSLTGGTLTDNLYGGEGSDTLVGGSGWDYYFFSSDDYGGHDTLYEAPGGGTDTLDFSAVQSGVSVDLELAEQSISNGPDLTLNQPGQFENVIGTPFGDLLYGNSQINFLSGLSGDDQLYGRDGNDSLSGGGNTTNYSSITGIGGDQLFGGSGDDFLDGDDYEITNSGGDRLDGGDGNDVLQGRAGDDWLAGGAGNDRYFYFPDEDPLLGSDTIDEAANQDTDTLDLEFYNANVSVNLSLTTMQTVAAGILNLKLTNSTGIENLNGGALNDSLIGNSRNNIISGREGHDYLNGQAGTDSLIGGSGSDSYSIQPGFLGTKTITEGANVDNDSLDFSGFSTGVTFDLSSSAAQPIASGITVQLLNGSTAIENISTGSGNDWIYGNSRNNQISTAAGDDTVYGGAGDDYFDDGDGYDSIEGDDGNDYFYGGSGDDYFSGGAGNDEIYGGEGDDSLYGGDGNDSLGGDGGTNQLYGEGGNDTLYSYDSNYLSGGAGNDNFVIYQPYGTLIQTTIAEAAGQGSDTLTFSSFTSGATVNLSTSSQQTVLANLLKLTLTNNSGGPAQIENVTGGSGNDTLTFNPSASGLSVPLVTFQGGGGTADRLLVDGVASGLIQTAQAGTQVVVDANGNTGTFDLHNVERVEVNDNGGAVAVESTYLVNTVADVADLAGSDAGNRLVRAGADGQISLRAALKAAGRASGAAAINFALSGAQTIDLSLGELVVDSNVEIDGPGTDLLTVDANGQSRVFNIASGTNVTIADLTITGGYINYFGGGIYSLGNLTLDRVKVQGNVAYHGGGIHESGGSLNIVESSIIENEAIFSSGGIYAVGASSLTLHSSLIARNEALNYAGMLAYDTNTEILNSTISTNTAKYLASGVYLYANSPRTAKLVNVTVADNVVTHSTGSGVYVGNMNVTATMHNTIVAGNTSTAGADDVRGTFSAASSYNLIGAIDNSTGLNSSTSFWGTNTNVLDAGLTALADHGGPTETHALLDGSLAIDSGSDAVAALFDLDDDQRGETRFADGDGDSLARVDIGSFELGADEYFGSL